MRGAGARAECGLGSERVVAQAEQPAPGAGRRRRRRQPVADALHRRDGRHPRASALLGRRHRYCPPVLDAPLGALARQSQHRAFAQQRLQRRHAELGGLLDERIHALVARHADGQRHGQRQFAIDLGKRQHARRHLAPADGEHHGIGLAPAAVEEHDRIARLHAPHLGVAHRGRGQLEPGPGDERGAGGLDMQTKHHRAGGWFRAWDGLDRRRRACLHELEEPASASGAAARGWPSRSRAFADAAREQ